MRRLIYGRRVRGDFESIRDYISRDRPAAGMRLVQRLIAACEELVEFPEAGRLGVEPGTRELVTVSPYIVVYTVTDETVEVSRIFHAAQDR